jgi:hypothetical protein
MSDANAKADDDFGQLPKVHPRHNVLLLARNDLAQFKLEWTKKYDLSSSELYYLMTQEMLDEAAYCVRAERKTRKKWNPTDAD